MKNWFKSLNKDSIQRIIFFGLMAILFTAFFVSLQFVSNEDDNVVDDPSSDVTPTPSTPDEKPEVDEKFMAPTKNTSYKILRTYFDASLDEKELESAVMKYDDGKFICSLGISIANDDGETFDVVATLSGVVDSVSKDSLYGNIVTIKHSDGYVSEYSSLSEVNVKVGDEISQGDVIGKSGLSEVDSDAKNHVYFIVRKDNETINPLTLFGKTLEELK